MSRETENLNFFEIYFEIFLNIFTSASPIVLKDPIVAIYARETLCFY